MILQHSVTVLFLYYLTYSDFVIVFNDKTTAYTWTCRTVINDYSHFTTAHNDFFTLYNGYTTPYNMNVTFKQLWH